MDDFKIIELYNGRNESAIALTAEKYGAYLMRVAFNVLHNYEDSEECVSDSYMRTWNSVPPEQPKSLKMYVAKIARNCAIDKYLAKNADKRGGGQVVLCLDELSEIISDDSCIESSGVTDIINEYLKQQDAKHSKMFVRRYWYMDSIADIATYCNCSESKVKTSLFRMRQDLKKILSKEGVRI